MVAMPVAAKAKKLYIAKSLQQLNEIAVDKTKMPDKKNIKQCSRSAKVFFDAATKSFSDGDEERAYVLYMRYFDTIVNIRKHSEYKSNMNFYDSLHTKETCKQVLDTIDKLQTSLQKRYDLLKDSEAKQADELACKEKMEASTDASEGSTDGQTSPGKTEINGEKAEKKPIVDLITSTELYNLIQNNSVTLLIMDARPKKDFEESHLTHKDCFSVPEEILKPGKIAANLEQELHGESRVLFNNRDCVDFVIILDWNSSDAVLLPQTPLKVLKDAIYKWGQDKILKSEPLVLKNGYEDWLLRYPMFTTNPKVVVPELKNSHLLPDIYSVQIEYPDLDTAFLSSPEASFSLNNSGELSPSDIKKSIDGMNNILSVKNLKPAINRNLKPLPPVTKINNFINEKNSKKIENTSKGQGEGLDSQQHVPSSQTQSVQQPKPQPEINRRLKPSLVSRNSSEEKESYKPSSDAGELPENIDSKLSSNVMKAEKLGEEMLEISKEALAQEKEFDFLRERRLREAEEGMRKDLQDQEEFMRKKLSQMENELKEKEKEFAKVIEEQTKMREELKEKDQMHQELKTELNKIREMEEKRKAMEKEAQRLREERKKKEKEKMEKEALAKEQAKEQQTKKLAGAPSVSDKPPSEPKPPATFEKPTIVIDRENVSQPSEYTTKLNAEESSWKSNLSRSRSFPNLSSLGEDLPEHQPLPRFDRSLKPSDNLDTSMVRQSRGRSYESNVSRTRSLSPTCGQEGTGLSGLKNLGNTCYMNATLQCLANTIHLAMHFVSGQYRSQINRNSKHGTGGEVAEEFGKLIRQMYNKEKSVAPKHFKALMGRLYHVYSGYEQQDAHEFLLNLMDKLHEDLNRVHGNRQSPSPDLDNCDLNTAINAFWCSHLDKNYSIISHLFEGLLVSNLTCLHCKKSSNSFEVFTCLSLPIPQKMTGICSLQDSLNLFLETEKISGEAAWDCPSCKQKRPAEKKMMISRLPKILIIQFNRFRFEGHWHSKKLQTFINFPVTGLDMNRYVDASQIGAKARPTYNLYAFLNHYGTLATGHYIAYCKAGLTDNWYVYDDASVMETSITDKDKHNAYILFYSSIDNKHQLNSNLRP